MRDYIPSLLRGLLCGLAVFGADIVSPAQTPSRPPRVAVDESHNNFHTISGSFASLAELLRQNGFDVTAMGVPITRENLAGVTVFVSANPFPAPRSQLVQQATASGESFRWSRAANRSAFAPEEIATLREWVREGGALLLVLDHAPHGSTGGPLASAFGVETRNVETSDSSYQDPVSGDGTLLFTRQAGLLGEHPVLSGVDSVVTYQGQSLSAALPATTLLRLPPTARDRDWLPETGAFRVRTAEGRAQAIALEYGRGRVIVLGEAGMLTSAPGSGVDGPGSDGLARNDRGNRRLAVNIVRWLAGQKIQ